MSGIELLAKQFGGKIVDLSNDSVIVEMAAKTERVDAFLKLVRPYGILEAARSGLMVMPRGKLSLSLFRKLEMLTWGSHPIYSSYRFSLVWYGG